jgi:hypothetical protein
MDLNRIAKIGNHWLCMKEIDISLDKLYHLGTVNFKHWNIQQAMSMGRNTDYWEDDTFEG